MEFLHHANACRHLPCTVQSRRALGLSMVELLCSLTITLILLGSALPMCRELRASQALQATAALLETDLQYARSLAVTGPRSVRLSVQALDAGGSCYVVHTGAAHACRCTGGGQAQCEPGAELLRLSEQDHRAGIALAPVSRSILFDGSKGTITPTATFKVTDGEGRAIHQVVNIMGRIRSCVPAGALGGLRPC
jgi:type IV fimbrial biogenesis protein FimT